MTVAQVQELFQVPHVLTDINHLESGIPFDLIHCVGNFAMCFALQPALTKALKKLSERPQLL